MGLNAESLYVPRRTFTEAEHNVWKSIMEVQRPRRERQLHPIFMEGLKTLRMDTDRIPDLEDVNKLLFNSTGWQARWVRGFEEPESFYYLLSQKIFPIGNFIRDAGQLSYTPAPDVAHDLYGHIPWLADSNYANFNWQLGQTAMKYVKDPARFRQFERFYWFTIEFALIETPVGRRIFGAGIASSIGECEYALSDKPRVLPFDIETIRNQEFDITQMQTTLFLLKNERQLYGSLGDIEKAIKGA